MNILLEGWWCGIRVRGDSFLLKNEKNKKKPNVLAPATPGMPEVGVYIYVAWYVILIGTE